MIYLLDCFTERDSTQFVHWARIRNSCSGVKNISYIFVSFFAFSWFLLRSLLWCKQYAYQKKCHFCWNAKYFWLLLTIEKINTLILIRKLRFTKLCQIFFDLFLAWLLMFTRTDLLQKKFECPRRSVLVGQNPIVFMHFVQLISISSTGWSNLMDSCLYVSLPVWICVYVLTPLVGLILEAADSNKTAYKIPSRYFVALVDYWICHLFKVLN